MTAETASSYDRDATIDVGISLAHDLSLNQAVAAASGTGTEDGGGLGGGLCYLNSPVRLAAFGVYWDVSTGQLAMVDPLVIGPKGTIICGLPDGISNGTYYCNVTRDTKTDTYTAQIENKEAGSEDGTEDSTESVASVKLFTLSDNNFTQHHMGAIIVPETKVAKAPWTYANGKWTNCAVQIGVHILGDASISDREQPDDGKYYCEVSVGGVTAKVKQGDTPSNDLENNMVYFHVGTVKGGKQTDGIYSMPIIYTYL